MTCRTRLGWVAALASFASVGLGCQGEVSGMPGAAAGGPAGSGMPAMGGIASTAQGPAAGGDAMGDDCSAPALAPRRLWRLTPAEYDNTVHDLLGVDSHYGSTFPADAVVKGFENNADALLMSSLLADKMQSAAQELATKADLKRFAPCVASQQDDACLRELAANLGERAFRRPLEPTEVERYFELAKTSPQFDAGARLMLTAMLQSPYFLYRFELGDKTGDGRYLLTDYEIASELSYMLWQTMPDDALFEAARSSALHTPAQVEAQVERMLSSERARPVVRAFVFEWLGLSTIATVPKDTARFPELTNDVRAGLIAEAERFVDHVMFDEDGSIAALLTSPTTFLDAKLASFYGVSLPSASDAPVEVELRDQERRGILTLGGTMLAHSRSNDSSPVHRGKLVRERFLCQILQPPPPGIVVQPPPLDPEKTTRERYAAHSVNEPCATCHRLMDPIGLAFEHFDGIGRYRPTDNGHPIDVSGEILGSPHTDGTFVGTDQLIDKLVASDDVRSCYSLQWFRFAYGMDDDDNGCLARRVQQAMGQTDGSLAAIIETLTQADAFYARRASPDAAASSDQDPALQPSAADSDADSASMGSKPDAGQGPDLPPGLEVTLAVDNDFGTGYCRTYQLDNHGGAAVTWSVPLDVSGTINQHWECQISADSGQVTFSGEDYNKSLQPGGSAQFGFCAQR